MATEPSLLIDSHEQTGTRLDPSLFPKTVNSLPNMIEYYRLTCRVEKKSIYTISGYVQRLTEFLRFIIKNNYSIDVNQITRHIIRLFMLDLQDKNLAASTQHTYYQVLHSFFAWLITEGILKQEHPMNNIHPPKLPAQMPKSLTEEQVKKVLYVAAQDVPSGNVRRSAFLPLRNTAMVLVFLDTALRLSEMTNIMLKNIDTDNDSIIIKGKGEKERRVRMGLMTHKAVLRYVLSRSDDLPNLWVTEERKPMRRDGVRITIKRIFQRAGITGIKFGPHALRHTSAIMFLRNGGTEFPLQIMLGHTTLQMTRRYVSALSCEDMMKVHVKASPVDNLKLK